MQKLRLGLTMVGLTTLAGIGDMTVRRGDSRPPDCKFPDTTEFVGPTVVSDFSDGVSSDGRGPYSQGSGGIVASAINNEAALTFYYSKDTNVANPRSFRVNLNRPVPGGGGRPLGIVIQRDRSGSGLLAQRPMLGNSFQNLNTIPVGGSVTAAQTNVTFHVDGRRHTLQMGPQPFGHCMGATRVNGSGTSSATIYRTSQTKWVVDLPSGSTGRLFDIDKLDIEHPIDKGLYYVRLHYEIGK